MDDTNSRTKQTERLCTYHYRGSIFLSKCVQIILYKDRVNRGHGPFNIFWEKYPFLEEKFDDYTYVRALSRF